MDVVIDYTNYRGERAKRKIRPISIKFGSNQWHAEPQWLMDALDLDKNEVRTFAMRDIHETIAVI